MLVVCRIDIDRGIVSEALATNCRQTLLRPVMVFVDEALLDQDIVARRRQSAVGISIERACEDADAPVDPRGDIARAVVADDDLACRIHRQRAVIVVKFIARPAADVSLRQNLVGQLVSTVIRTTS